MIDKWEMLFDRALEMNKKVFDVYNTLYRKFDKFACQLGNLS